MRRALITATDQNHVDIDLMLAGHTHGSVVRVPFLGGFVVPNQGAVSLNTATLFIQRMILPYYLEGPWQQQMVGPQNQQPAY